ncbi:MAG TPA: YfhO family protein [Terriglobia bacterium]|nr:YfhO family protein [Terriglobia bacterium]
MNTNSLSKRSFWYFATGVFGLMVLVTYAPVLAGRVPFPRDLVLRHVAWSEVAESEPGQRTPEIGDLITSFYPFHALASRAIQEKELPLWNPYILAGAPFQANSQSAMFYPLNSLYYILPINAAWTISLIIRLFLAAMFMALFVRAIGGSTAGSIVSGLIFSSCGFITSWQGQGLGDAAIWLPMICYSVHRLHHERSFFSIALAAFAFAMPVLAGHPETAFHSTITGSALALFFWISPDKPGGRAFDRRFLLCFATAGVLAVGLASVQIIPTLEWLGHTGSPFDVPWPALSRHDGQGFFSRDVGGSPNSAGIPIPEAAAYIGMFSLLAAPFALFHRHRRYVLFLVAVTLAATAVAYSVQPIHWIVDHLPIVKALKNGRLILVISFGIAAMAGLGVSVMENFAEAVTPRRRAIAKALLGGAVVVAGLGIFEVHRATLSPVDLTRGPAASLAFLIAGVALLGAQIRGWLKGRLFPILACALAAFELVSFSYGYTGFSRTADVFPAAPVFEFLSRQGDPATFRVAKAGFPIPVNSGIMYKLHTADGYDICTTWMRIFNNDLTLERDDGIFFLADKLSQSTDRRLDMLNVKYLVVIAGSPDFEQLAVRPDRFAEVYKQGSIAVFENKFVLPRLFAAPQTGIEVIGDTAAQLGRLKDPAFNPERTAILAEEPAGFRRDANSPGEDGLSTSITLVDSGTNASTFHVQTSGPSVLVLSQIYYPGWKATIDGSPVQVHPVDFALSGILSPQGDHTVRFFFDPQSFKIGGALSGISVAVFIGLLLFRSRA